MTLIIFFDHKIRDTVVPTRTLRLQAGRGGCDPEQFWMGNGVKQLFLDREQAGTFLTALAKMASCVQRGRLTDRSFYAHDIYDAGGICLGINLGILVGRPYIALDDLRVDVSPDDLLFFAAACAQAHYLCGVGVSDSSLVRHLRREGRFSS
jgi:hypothetical protein